MESIKHYSHFPATGVSLRQMVQFGERPSVGTMFRASQFLSEELPIRLAHRVQELCHLPDGLGDMPSIERVTDWYAQSFEEITQLPRPNLSTDLKQRLMKPSRQGRGGATRTLPAATQNPSLPHDSNSNGNGHSSSVRRYFAPMDDGGDWPPELADYNKRFTSTLDKIKRRHDGVVPTVGMSIFHSSIHTSSD